MKSGLTYTSGSVRDVGQTVNVNQLIREERKGQWQKRKQLLADMLPITWHLTQQLLVQARVLFTHRYTSAVHKHSQAHAVIPAHTTEPLKKITDQWQPAVIMAYCVRFELCEQTQADGLTCLWLWSESKQSQVVLCCEDCF